MFQKREGFWRQGHVRARLHYARRQSAIRQREPGRRREVRVPRGKPPRQSKRGVGSRRTL